MALFFQGTQIANVNLSDTFNQWLNTTNDTLAASVSQGSNNTFTGENTFANNVTVSGNTTFSAKLVSTGTFYTNTLYLNGANVTATAVELNKLDGVTSTTAELNILDGVTADATELNYNDGALPGVITANKTLVANGDGTLNFPTGTLKYDGTIVAPISANGFSVTTNAPSGNGSLSYSSVTGVFTFTPADVSSGSGGDAATLDGLDSTQFLRSDASDAYTSGTLTLNSGTTQQFNSTTVNFSSGTTVNFDRTTGTAPFTVDSGTVVTNLNADQVDGLEASEFLRSGATDAYTSGTLSFNAGTTQNFNSTTVNFSSSTQVNFNETTGTSPFTVDSTTLVTNLNADQVDGIDASSLLRSDAADIKTSGDLTFNDNIKLLLGTSGGESEIYSDGTNTYWNAKSDKDIIFRDDNSATNRFTFDISSGTLTATTFSGGYSGSGASLTNLNASQLSSGTVPLARLSGITTSEIDATTLLTAADAWANNDTSIATAAAITQRIEALGGGGGGSVTSVSVGTGLDVTNPTSTPNITIDSTEFTEITSFNHTGGSITTEDSFLFHDITDNAIHRILAGNIPISAFNNDAGYASGDITSVTVTAGNGLSGGGTGSSGSVSLTLTVGSGDGITVGATDVAVDSTVVRTSGTQTVAGAKTFSTGCTFSAAPAFTAAGAPFTTTSTTLVTNLNADLLDSLSSADFLRSNASDTYSGTMTVSSGGIVLNDNIELSFGTSAGESEIFSNGTHTYWNSKSSTKDIYFSQAGVNEFLFNMGNASFHADGDITAYSTSTSSDLKLKQNILTIENPIEKIKQLNGVTFDWKKDGTKSAGLIAQDVQKILPEVVKEVANLNDDETHLNLNYNGVIGLLVEAVKEQQKQIDEQKELINTLVERLEVLGSKK
jgi:hypothetical protein